MTPSQLERFEVKYIPDPNSGCWLWTASGNTKGYGQMNINGKLLMAHKLSYQHFVGEFPAGLQMDHLCRVRCCVNPLHLEPVTPRENALRGLNPSILRARMLSITHCPRGHAYDAQNTYIIKKKPSLPNGGRECRECHRIRARVRNARRKQHEVVL